MLGTFNICKDLKKNLDRELLELDSVDDLPEVSGLFIDWITKEHSMFPKQAVIIEHYVKAGIPIIIYDRWLALEKQEFNWLKKFNVSFFEPAIVNRTGFEYGILDGIFFHAVLDQVDA